MEKTKETHTENYVGKWVFLVKSDPKDTYGNGEYFIVQQTPHMLYGVRLIGGYEGHDMKSFVIDGKPNFEILDCRVDDEAAKTAIDQMNDWGDAPARKEKLNWVEYVYANIKTNARMAEKAIQRRRKLEGAGEPEPTKKAVSVITIFSDGTAEVKSA